MKISLRPQKLSDAKALYQILCHPKNIYKQTTPASIWAVRKSIIQNWVKQFKGHAYIYTVLVDGKVGGRMSLRRNLFRKNIAEIGVVLAEEFQGKGIASQLIQMAEQKGSAVGIRRFVLCMHTEHKASQRVAEKNGYVLEGTLNQLYWRKTGKFLPMHVYAKNIEL